MKATFSYRLFAHVVDTSGAADVLAAGLRTSRRGRPQNGSPRTFLILLLLAAADGELTIERMHHIATRELPRNVQIDLGTVRSVGDRWVDMPIHELYYISRTITRKLSWSGPNATSKSEPGTDDAEVARKQDLLRNLSDRLIRATLPERPGSSYALDESGIWAWAKGRKPRHPATTADALTDDVTNHGPRRTLSACPDAAWGIKTGKDGQRRRCDALIAPEVGAAQQRCNAALPSRKRPWSAPSYASIRDEPPPRRVASGYPKRPLTTARRWTGSRAKPTPVWSRRDPRPSGHQGPSSQVRPAKPLPVRTSPLEMP